MNFDFSPNKNILPTRGKVLLSEPFLDDPYFKRTVVLLCEHNHEGSFGFVLNNYIDVNLDQIVDDMPIFPSKISIGGPVRSSNLYYIHTLGETIEDSMEILPGLYMGGDFENLRKLMLEGKVQKDQVRFFVGYSGWSPDQLKGEIDQNAWFVSDIEMQTVMDTDIEDLWKYIMKKLGRKGEMIANLPEDPTLN
ncbi:MAG: YqgE/AlgH family protein [Flavobacteriales bacterium]